MRIAAAHDLPGYTASYPPPLLPVFFSTFHQGSRHGLDGWKARARPSSLARISSLARCGRSLAGGGVSAGAVARHGSGLPVATITIQPDRQGPDSSRLVAWALVDVKARARPSSPARGSGLSCAVDSGQEGKSQPGRSLGMVPACPWLRSPSSQTAKGRIPLAHTRTG
jgi:hypothetical protein